MIFETVYTMTDYWDGPRRGIADYQGSPHRYESQFAESEENNYQDTFLLSPVQPELFAYALQDWEIWRRWESAFHQGKTTIDTHPALPEEREAHERLKAILRDRLRLDPNKILTAQAIFRKREDPTWDQHGWAPLEVCWITSKTEV